MQQDKDKFPLVHLQPDGPVRVLFKKRRRRPARLCLCGTVQQRKDRVLKPGWSPGTLCLQLANSDAELSAVLGLGITATINCNYSGTHRRHKFDVVADQLERNSFSGDLRENVQESSAVREKKPASDAQCSQI